MPSVYDLKPRFQAALRPTAARLARAGVRANAVTTTAAVLSVAFGLTVAVTGISRLLLLYPALLLVRMALNALDGMLAREFHRPTPLGALLNETGDLVSDAALYLPLAYFLPAPPWLTVSVVVLALISEGAGITAQTLNGLRRYDGPFGKSDRAVLFSVLAVVTALDVFAVGVWMPGALVLLLVLAAWTVVNRVRRGLTG
jgi:CDP-diacylglycerol--glycerol-3-phosphate 3-phosphatidyltransferase